MGIENMKLILKMAKEKAEQLVSMKMVKHNMKLI